MKTNQLISEKKTITKKAAEQRLIYLLKQQEITSS